VGHLTAVAVFDAKPTNDELLNWHLQMGWTAQVSELQGGPRILGYAACRFKTD